MLNILNARGREHFGELNLLYMAGRPLGKQSVDVLKKLFDAAESVLEGGFQRSLEYDRRIWAKNAGHTFYNLGKSGYIKKIEKQPKGKKNRSFFHLTPKGRWQVLKYLHLEKIRKKWDKRWRIVIFDIPEDNKKWRERSRYKLKALGFHALQESVYITPYPVTQELDKYLEDWKLREYFRYITVTEIDDEPELKKKFDLK